MNHTCSFNNCTTINCSFNCVLHNKMVLTHNFQEIYDVTDKSIVLNLPQYKENPLKVEFEKCTEIITQYNGPTPPLPFAASELFHASIVNWRRLTADDKECKPIYEVTFDIQGSNFTFKPGDTIGVLPENNKNEVDAIIRHLNLTEIADASYSLSVESSQKIAKIPPHVPVKSSLRHVLTHCVDIRTVIKKLFLLALSRYTKDNTERKVLEYLCSKEGTVAYNTHILNKNICLLDIFAKFKSCKPPVEVLLLHLSRLLPRAYSIVNSPSKNPDVLKICFSVMDIGNNRKGLTTGWIEQVTVKGQSLEDGLKNLNLSGNDSFRVPIYLRKNMNGFELPKDPKIPLILVGPGTGVSPFIGFLEDREYLIKNKPETTLGPIWMFFGCRHPKLDFIYEKDLNGFVTTNILTALETAFSRYENWETKYVQDIIMKHGADIVNLIKKGAAIYVCGDVKTMASQVRDTFVNCLIKHDGKTMEEAEKSICDMQKEKTYIVDIWN